MIKTPAKRRQGLLLAGGRREFEILKIYMQSSRDYCLVDRLYKNYANYANVCTYVAVQVTILNDQNSRQAQSGGLLFWPELDILKIQTRDCLRDR
jgi:hypothetical protein